MSSIINTRVAIVGGAGFLGSHLVNFLLEERNCEVLVIDNLVAGKREFIHPKATFEHADITESERRLYDLFKGYKIEYVLNYAAVPYIPISFARPLYVFNVNALGAIQVINAAQEAGCKGICQISSAELYGHQTNIIGQEIEEHREGKIAEWMPVNPHSSYGAAKAAVDYYCQVAWKERKTPVIALRQFNCVGERETHPYVIPEIISQLFRSISSNPSTKGRIKLGNNSERDFMYAGDAVRMAVELLESEKWGEVFNLGSEQSIKIYDLAYQIGKLMNFREVRIEEDPARKRPWEIWHLQSDNTKINSVVSYRPTVSLEEALTRTIKSYRATGYRWVWE